MINKFILLTEYQLNPWALFRVSENAEVGRFMVATRDIEPGEIVLLDRAVVVAPDDRPGNNLIGVSSIIQRALYAFNVRFLLRCGRLPAR